MALRRSLLVALLALSTSLLTIQPASAARIYNLLPISVWVGGIDGDVTLKSQEKSPSVSWGLSTIIDVYALHHSGNALCRLWFGVHAEIAGGHYMIIGHQGKRIVCTLCDSDGKAMYHDSATAPEEFWSELQDKSSKTGC